MTANTTNMDVPSNPPSDISYILETQMTPTDTSKIKTEPSKILNVSCDIIVTDSNSEDSILNFTPETASSTENAIPHPMQKMYQKLPLLMMNKRMRVNLVQVIKFQKILCNFFT